MKTERKESNKFTLFQDLENGETFVDPTNFGKEYVLIKVGEDIDNIIAVEEAEQGDGAAVMLNDGSLYFYGADDKVYKTDSTVTFEFDGEK